jgi:hypothetical protein
MVAMVAAVEILEIQEFVVILVLVPIQAAVAAFEIVFGVACNLTVRSIDVCSVDMCSWF